MQWKKRKDNVQRSGLKETPKEGKTGSFWPLSLPQTAFTRLYSILRQNPESLENTGISLRAFTAFYTCLRIQILSSAPSKNLEAITVSRFFLFLVKTFLLRFGIVPSVGYIVGDIVIMYNNLRKLKIA